MNVSRRRFAGLTGGALLTLACGRAAQSSQANDAKLPELRVPSRASSQPLPLMVLLHLELNTRSPSVSAAVICSGASSPSRPGSSRAVTFAAAPASSSPTARRMRLPIDRCSRQIVPVLERQGYDVTFRQFDGGHEIPPNIAAAGFRFAAGSS